MTGNIDNIRGLSVMYFLMFFALILIAAIIFFTWNKEPIPDIIISTFTGVVSYIIGLQHGSKSNANQPINTGTDTGLEEQ